MVRRVRSWCNFISSRRLIALTALACFSSCGALVAQTRPIAIVGGTLIDGTGRPPLTDATVVIENGRFQKIGKTSAVPIPANAEVIQAAGETILPGLIDGHCHYQSWMRELFLVYGVTTCPDILGDADTKGVLAQREAISKGVLRGPRLWTAGMHLDGPPLPQLQGSGGAQFPGIVHTPEEARKLVRELVGMGVDGLKFYERMTPDLAKAAADEAHRLGRPVFGHSVDVFASVDAGYQSVEHFWSVAITSIRDPQKRAAMVLREARGPAGDHPGLEYYLYLTPEFYRDIDSSMFDPIIRAMVDHNVHWSPTWATWFRPLSRRADVIRQRELAILKDPRFAIPDFDSKRVQDIYNFYAQATPQRRAELSTNFRMLQDFARRFVAAGGKIHVGSDPNHVLPGFAVHVEMQLLTEAGLTPLQIIRGASLNVAKAWGKQKDYGSVESGKFADAIIVSGDPMKDIATTQNIEMVFKEGKLIAGTKYTP